MTKMGHPFAQVVALYGNAIRPDTIYKVTLDKQALVCLLGCEQRELTGCRGDRFLPVTSGCKTDNDQLTTIVQRETSVPISGRDAGKSSDTFSIRASINVNR